jgi:hypothetical protein
VLRISGMPPFFPAPSLFTPPLPPRAPIAVPTGLMDSGTYDGTQQTLGLTVKPHVGIAEYTNANFLSADTLPTNHTLDPWHKFPFPDFAETDEYVDINNRFYRERRRTTGQPLGHLMVLGYSSRFNVDAEIWGVDDDEVCEEYAEHLWPHAIGYAGAAVKYFFRGSLEVASTSASGDATVTVTVKNTTPQEDMTGQVAVYYDSARFGVRNVLTSLGGLGSLSPAPIQIPTGSTVTLPPFTRPTDFPPGKEDRYVVVFQGKLGAETNAVVGAIVEFAQLDVKVNGAGAVTSEPVGIINCKESSPPQDCTADFVTGAQVVLTATPDADGTFPTWTGCDTPADHVAAATCTVTMNMNRNVTAQGETRCGAQVDSVSVSGGIGADSIFRFVLHAVGSFSGPVGTIGEVDLNLLGARPAINCGGWTHSFGNVSFGPCQRTDPGQPETIIWTYEVRGPTPTLTNFDFVEVGAHCILTTASTHTEIRSGNKCLQCEFFPVFRAICSPVVLSSFRCQ